MIKSGSIFPLLAAIPVLISARKAAALWAAGALDAKAVHNFAQSYEPKKGRGYKKKEKGLRLPGTPHSWYKGSGLRIPGTVY